MTHRLTIRVLVAVRNRLLSHAGRYNRSLSEEASERLERSFDPPPKASAAWETAFWCLLTFSALGAGVGLLYLHEKGLF